MTGPLGLSIPGVNVHQHQVTTVTVVEWDERPFPPGTEGYDNDAVRRRATKLALGCPCGWMNVVNIVEQMAGAE